MSKFADRKGKALLVIDVQNGVVEGAWHRDEVVSNINSLVEKARSGDTEVIWIQHSEKDMPIESEDWKIVSELKPLESEPKVQKRFRSSFEETILDELLAVLGVNHLYISGAKTNNCVRHTVHAALERGYDVTLVEDAHTTSDTHWGTEVLHASAIVAEQNRSCSNYSLPGRTCDLATTSKVIL